MVLTFSNFHPFFTFECQRSTAVLKVGHKHSVYDVTCDANYSAGKNFGLHSNLTG